MHLMENLNLCVLYIDESKQWDELLNKKTWVFFDLGVVQATCSIIKSILQFLSPLVKLDNIAFLGWLLLELIVDTKMLWMDLKLQLYSLLARQGAAISEMRWELYGGKLKIVASHCLLNQEYSIQMAALPLFQLISFALFIRARPIVITLLFEEACTIFDTLIIPSYISSNMQ